MESSHLLSALVETDADRPCPLRRYDTLDTPSADTFERIITLTARLFDAPICLIALKDESRIWFKSKEELHDTEKVRELSLSDRVLGEETVFWVSDTQRDAKLAKHPLVTGEFGLRFFAAAPLLAPGGQPLGTLAVIDHRPRPINEKEKPICATWRAWSWTSWSCAARRGGNWKTTPSSARNVTATCLR